MVPRLVPQRAGLRSTPHRGQVGLRRLARRGLLDIRRDESDRRAARARLTERGAAVRDAILRYRHERIVEIVAGLQVSSSTSRDLVRVAVAFDVYR